MDWRRNVESYKISAQDVPLAREAWKSTFVGVLGCWVQEVLAGADVHFRDLLLSLAVCYLVALVSLACIRKALGVRLRMF